MAFADRQRKSPIGDFLPTHESQVRHLAKIKDEEKDLDDERIPVVWNRAVVTAQENNLNAPTEEIVLDEVREEIGWEPPDKPSEVERILRLIRNLSPRKRAALLKDAAREWPDAAQAGPKAPKKDKIGRLCP